MTFDSALILAIAICLLTVKPGPGMLLIISKALADGFFPAFAIALGIVTIQIFYFSLSVAGISIMENHMEALSYIMKSIAATYMFYLGVRGLMRRHHVAVLGVSKRGKKLFFENYSAGVLITLSNPFVILFYAAVVPSILDLKSVQGSDIVISLVIIGGLNLMLLSGEALLASHVRESLKDTSFIRRLNTFTSISFICIGLFLTYTLLPLFSASLGFGHI